MQLPISESLIVTDILSHTGSELSQLIVQILDTSPFRAPVGGLRETTYDGHLGLIGKRVVDFLLVLTELLSLSVTVEELRANIG